MGSTILSSPPPPVRPSPINTYRPSRPHYQDSRPHAPAMPGNEDTEFVGGAISSPRHIDRRRQAATARISHFDIAALADAQYHGGSEGYYPLTPALIHKCGYTAINSVDVISSYNELILVHESVMTNWVGRFTVGPQIDRILEKGLVSLPRLQSLAVESAVEWYDTLQKTLLIYLVPLTPLDCVMVKMGYEALCIPGTGLTRYPVAARVLLELLPRLLPKTDDEVTSIINMVRMESNNGYDLLWRILELTVPGFDPTVPVTLPTWSDDGIFDFAHAFLLYYRLLSKKGEFHDDKTRSTTFLQAIKDYAFADIITTLLTCINNYFSVDDDGYLPASLCIMGLAHQLNKSAKLRANSVLPRAHRLTGESPAWQFDVPIQGSPRVFRLDAGGRDRPPPREGRDGRDNRGGRGFQPRPFTPGGRNGGSRPPPADHPRGRFVRPDRNGRKWDPDLICDACRRSGHIAAQCDMLAIAIFIEKYKKEASPDMKDKIEEAWLARWKGELGNPSKKPRRVMKAYIDSLDSTVDAVDEQMCWECWPEDDGGSEFGDSA